MFRNLEKKRREHVYTLLSETETLGADSRWRDAKKILAEDERFAKFMAHERVSGKVRDEVTVRLQKMERDFRDWVDELREKVQRDYKELLRETKIITYKSQKQIAENEQHLKDILAVLEVSFN